MFYLYFMSHMTFSSNFLHAVTFLHVLYFDVLRRKIEIETESKNLMYGYNARPPMAIPIYTLPYCVIQRVIISHLYIIYTLRKSTCQLHACTCICFCVCVFVPYRTAKLQQLRIWKGYQPSSSATIPQGSRSFSGKVVEVVNGDALVIKRGDQQHQKIWLSSIRPPRLACS